MRKDKFTPDDITKDDMNRLADAIESYLTLFTEIMIIPDDIKDKCKKKMDEGIARSRKLVKKLRKGDRSVFKASDEWEDLY